MEVGGHRGESRRRHEWFHSRPYPPPVKRFPRLVVFATGCAVIAYPAVAIFGVIYLVEGEILLGVALLGCLVVGVPSFIAWRRQFR